MLRSVANRNALRSLATTPKPLPKVPFRQPFTAQIWTVAARRPQALAIAKPLALMRMQSADRKPVDNIDEKKEASIGKEKLEAHPDLVSSTSSVHQIRHEVGVNEESHEADMLSGIRSDMKTIRETFSFSEVPREAYYIGMAGVLPYLATSLSTVYCAYEINTAAAHGTGLLLNEHQAELLLHILEPLQIGYGATIISFLGAIHWGLEFGGYNGYRGYPRYAVGVVSTALAWPTILLPVEYALISQFLIFNFLYYTDSRASKSGWAPPWYSVYRFVLTFIVGSAIVVSLVGRGQIADRITRLPGPAQRIQQLRESQAQSLAEEEEAKRGSALEEDEAEGGDDEE